MMTSIKTKTPHYSILEKLKYEIKERAKIYNASFNCGYMKAREQILLPLGFSSSYEFDQWVKCQISNFDNINNDKLRLKSLNTPPQPYHKMQYYYFTSEITLRPNLEDHDNHRWPLCIGADLEPRPLMSVWVGERENVWDEIREPSNDVDAEYVYQRDVNNGELIYVIRDIFSFSRWFFLWGGKALIEERLFTDEYIGTDMLARYEVVNNLHKEMYQQMYRQD